MKFMPMEDTFRGDENDADLRVSQGDGLCGGADAALAITPGAARLKIHSAASRAGLLSSLSTAGTFARFPP